METLIQINDADYHPLPAANSGLEGHSYKIEDCGIYGFVFTLDGEWIGTLGTYERAYSLLQEHMILQQQDNHARQIRVGGGQ